MPDRRVLALEDARRAGEDQDFVVDAGGLRDAALLGEVALEHREPAVLGEGVRGVTDDVGLEATISGRLTGFVRLPPSA